MIQRIHILGASSSGTTTMCLECGQSLKQLSVRHLKEHGLDGHSYRAKYGIPRTQALAAKETTLKRKEIVQRSRPWEKALTYVKAQEKAQNVSHMSGEDI
jgi:predicted transcriptional regulator